MTIDITQCIKINIIDSCALWNILSSLVLLARLDEDNFSYSTTKFVEYECLIKKRTKPTDQDDELKLRFLKQKDKFPCHDLSIEDLQDNDLLFRSANLGIGELSCIAFCKKTNQTFLTDDKNARKFAKQILGDRKVQTIPHLLGWLIYKGIVSDTDLELIIKEHNFHNRPLEKYFREVNDEALRIRCIYG